MFGKACFRQGEKFFPCMSDLHMRKHKYYKFYKKQGRCTFLAFFLFLFFFSFFFIIFIESQFCGFYGGRWWPGGDAFSLLIFHLVLLMDAIF